MIEPTIPRAGLSPTDRCQGFERGCCIRADRADGPDVSADGADPGERRHPLLYFPIYWIDEFAVYSVVWLTFIGASAMTRLRLDFAVTMMTERLRREIRRSPR